MHECMVRLCILLNSLLYICKSELRKSQYWIKGFYCATEVARGLRALPLGENGRSERALSDQKRTEPI